MALGAIASGTGDVDELNGKLFIDVGAASNNQKVFWKRNRIIRNVLSQAVLYTFSIS